tara:strand:- start:736 stop:948 length:213 start_codon:yes stop_codon:yes gene_type:complete
MHIIIDSTKRHRTKKMTFSKKGILSPKAIMYETAALIYIKADPANHNAKFPKTIFLASAGNFRKKKSGKR